MGFDVKKKKRQQFLSFTPHLPCMVITHSFHVAMICFQIFLVPQTHALSETKCCVTFIFSSLGPSSGSDSHHTRMWAHTLY